jgi:hypothetical protein
MSCELYASHGAFSTRQAAIRWAEEMPGGNGAPGLDRTTAAGAASVNAGPVNGLTVFRLLAIASTLVPLSALR